MPRHIFRLAYGQFLRQDLLKKRVLLFFLVREHHEGSRMPFGDLSGGKRAEHLLREDEETEAIRDIFAAFAHLLRDFRVLEAEFLRQAGKSERAVDRIKIFTLEVLNDGKLELEPRVGLAVLNDRGHPRHTGQLCRAQTPLPCDEFVFYGKTACVMFGLLASDDQWLEDAVLADRVRKVPQMCFIEFLARLVRVRLDLLDFNPKNSVILKLHHALIVARGKHGRDLVYKARRHPKVSPWFYKVRPWRSWMSSHLVFVSAALIKSALLITLGR